MCNKQTIWFKYNIKPTSICKITVLLPLLFVSVLLSSCQVEPKPSDKNNVVIDHYPRIAQQITDRDFEGLFNYTEHENSTLSGLAWRAIAHSNPEVTDEFVEHIINIDQHDAWFALSLQDLSGSQIEMILQYHRNGSIDSEGVCEVFFRHGDDEILQYLLADEEGLLQSDLCSRAVGGITTRVPVDDFTKQTIFDLVFNTDNFTIQRNLLYGMYRTTLNRPRQGDTIMRAISQLFEYRGVQFTPELDEFLLRIAGREAFNHIMERRSDRDLNLHTQLSNELARNMITFDDANLPVGDVKRLLSHKAANVRAQALESLLDFDELDSALISYIEKEIAQQTRNSEVFVRSLTLLQQHGVEIENYKMRLSFFDNDNPHLKHLILPLFREMEDETEYLERIKTNIDRGGISGLRATQALSNYFIRDFNDPDRVEQTRELVFYALEHGDRSVISAIDVFLRNPRVIFEDDYDRIYEHYATFVENEQWEKANDLEEVMKNRFMGIFESLEIPEPSFYSPNWDRLYSMGTRPYWILETNRGNIEIELDPLSAPFTVSSIDSLTRADKYNDVPFHRVIRNFVAQGGDIDRKDGLGGPDYRLPTEPSINTFNRGKVGVASSGLDTEGSQFFINYQWTPHLDGDYTIFGRVTKGMDVADQIQIGDIIKKARISIR